MTASEFRTLALSMPGAIENAHMNHPDFRVGGKIFATLSANEEHGVVMLSPEEQKQFLAQAPDAFSPAAGAWGRGGSTRVHLAKAKHALVQRAIKAAWQKRAPRNERPSIAQSCHACPATIESTAALPPRNKP